MPVRPLQPPPVTLQDARARKGGAYPSPCVNVCRMSPSTGWCEGCWRTMDEIRCWSQLDDAARAACWVQVEARQSASAAQRLKAGGP